MTSINIATESGGFWEKEFFLYWLQKAYPLYKFNYNNDNANLLIKSVLGGGVTKKSPKYKETPTIHWTGESWDIPKNFTPNKKSLLITSYREKDPYILNIPYCSYQYILCHLLKINNKYKYNHKNRNKLLAYCASNTTSIRENFMRKFIEKSKKNNEIFCLGKCNQHPCSKKRIGKNGHTHATLIKEYSNYKFVMAFENKVVDNYITEKIINAFMSGAIPIYWGDHNKAKKLFNTDAFICVQDFKSSEDCIDYILSLDDSQINNMLNQPIFKDDIIPPEFDFTNLNLGCIYGDFVQNLKQFNL